MLSKVFFSLLLLTLSSFVQAANLASPLGTWQTISDETKQPSSLVKIGMENGVLVGQIQKLLPGSHFKPGDVCSACPDGLKNKPIIGLQFLWGFVPDENGTWKDGRVVDPKNGHTYRGTLKLVDQGRQLELRGYWGPFWRTQTWTRVTG
jgi:uncharacterized protein (DUF2147 family)